MNTKSFDNLQTYAQVCRYYHLFVNDKVGHPKPMSFQLLIFQIPGQARTYSEEDIKATKYVSEFNLHGFCIREAFATKYNKECDCYKADPSEIIKSKQNEEAKCLLQKAYVKGTMPRKLGEIMINELKKHKRLAYHICPETSEAASVEQKVIWQHSKVTNKLNMLINEYPISCKGYACCGTAYKCLPENMSIFDLVNVCIYDTIIGNDDEYMWKTVLEILQKYSIKINMQ